MANYPRITIVTPFFNQARYLEETIKSIIKQNYPNMEYIVIDGGSTDGSVDIIRQYEDQLSYYCSERDRGQSDAIMKGVIMSTGDLFSWLSEVGSGMVSEKKQTGSHPDGYYLYRFRK